ncbi:hypothetical protein ACFL18_02820 [Patescibacteria group bacterium]
MGKKTNINTLYTAIIIALILGLAIAFYGYFNYRAKIDLFRLQEEKDQEKTLQEKSEKSEQEKQRILCISEVKISSHDWWGRSCESLGLEKDCRLSSSEADTINKSREKNIANCIKMYPAN